MNTYETIVQTFTESFYDRCMLRSERSEIADLLREVSLSDNQKSVLRSTLFDLARKEMNSNNFETVTNWLEEVAKLLICSHVDTFDGHSRVYFSPGETCRNAIISSIRSANNELRICVFTISDNDIAKEIMAAHGRGVLVKIITDNEKQYDVGSDIHSMRNQGITIHFDNSSSHMHHKFLVVDTKSVLTGSYNWTHSAASCNQENVVVTDDQSVVKSFTVEFDRLWSFFG